MYHIPGISLGGSTSVKGMGLLTGSISRFSSADLITFELLNFNIGGDLVLEPFDILKLATDSVL